MNEQPQDERDERVLELREKRRSYGSIARLVGFERAAEAAAAFNRALRRRPAEEQETLRQAELARLDDMARHVRDDEGLSVDDAARRLRVVDSLRTRVSAP